MNRPDPNWLLRTRDRVAKCITWGLKKEQTKEVGEIMKVIANDWQELYLGSNGYLTRQGRTDLGSGTVGKVNMASPGHVRIDYGTFATWLEAARTRWLEGFGVDFPAHKKDWNDLAKSQGYALVLRKSVTEYKSFVRLR